MYYTILPFLNALYLMLHFFLLLWIQFSCYKCKFYMYTPCIYLNVCIMMQCIWCPRASLARMRMKLINHMMTSPSESFFRVTGLCVGDSPLRKGQWCGLWCFFDVGLLKLWNKQSNGRWFETTWRSCDVIVMICMFILVASECNPLWTGDTIWLYNSRWQF